MAFRQSVIYFPLICSTLLSFKYQKREGEAKTMATYLGIVQIREPIWVINSSKVTSRFYCKTAWNMLISKPNGNSFRRSIYSRVLPKIPFCDRVFYFNCNKLFLSFRYYSGHSFGSNMNAISGLTIHSWFRCIAYLISSHSYSRFFRVFSCLMNALDKIIHM